MTDMQGRLQAGGKTYALLSLQRALPADTLARIPYVLRVLFENALRNEPDSLVAITQWVAERSLEREIPFYPLRVLMHDTTCSPALADFAAMRDAVAAGGGDPARINPVIPVHLVIDHSIAVDHYGIAGAMDLNRKLDFARNTERYGFVRWAQNSLANFRVVPPGTGIIHQINLELLADAVTVIERPGDVPLACPDTLLGTDSHTPMIGALGILAWGVGGIEAQAAMLGQPLAVRIPDVVGVHMRGALAPGVTATDLVLRVTEMLRAHGVLGKFVEFFGVGAGSLSLADRATVANMAPEYGATTAFFPMDRVAIDYLRASGRQPAQLELIESYMRAQGLWWEEGAVVPEYSGLLELDLAAVEPCMAGPRLPHDRKPLSRVGPGFLHDLPGLAPKGAPQTPRVFADAGAGYALCDGAVVLAAITSCTNTSNPALVIGAGLLARKARALGLTRQPWVKTSLSPGSKVVADYLQSSGLQEDFDALGFNLAGYGCMTCIGNSGSLETAVVSAVEKNGLCAVGVLSGNRNFDGRVNPHLGAAYLASPALVVAYALVGNIVIDIANEPLGRAASGEAVYLRDIWPSDAEIHAVMAAHLTPQAYVARYRDVWQGSDEWQAIKAPDDVLFPWDQVSDYIRRPPYFDGFSPHQPAPLSLENARPFMILGDNVTTDHISPAGAIPKESLAGRHLLSHGVPVAMFNQYATRRSNHEVMLRGAFSNPRLVNELPGAAVPGGPTCLTLDAGGAQPMTAYEAAQSFRERGLPLVLLAGKNYGAGSSRDWAAKVSALLGVRAVIAASFERIHRSNLIGMGVIPLLLPSGLERGELCRHGGDTLSFDGLGALTPGPNRVTVTVCRTDGGVATYELVCQMDSQREIDTLRHGGILPYVVRGALAA